MITIDWILFVGMLAGTASLSAVMGLVIGMTGERVARTIKRRRRNHEGSS